MRLAAAAVPLTRRPNTRANEIISHGQVAKITSGGYPSGDDRHALTREELERTLTSIRAAGERTAIGGVSFKSIISMRLNTKPALSQARRARPHCVL